MKYANETQKSIGVFFFFFKNHQSKFMSNSGALTALRFHYNLPFPAQKAAKDNLLRRLHVSMK